MRFFLSFALFTLLFVLSNCQLATDKYIGDKLTTDVNEISGFTIPSKMICDDLSNDLYVFDGAEGVYRVDLTKVNLDSNNALVNVSEKLFTPPNSLTYYNVNSGSMETNTDIEFFTVDFTFIKNGSRGVFYSIVKANFDPDYVSSDDEGDYFEDTDWYYLYMVTDTSTDLFPLSYIPVNSSDTNYQSDSSCYSAYDITVIQNALYLSCGANANALRYFKLNDDYTVNEKFRQNKTNGNFTVKFAGNYNSTYTGVLSSGSVLASDTIPSYIFLTSRDEDREGLFLYENSNPKDENSDLKFIGHLDFPGDVYPYNLSFNPLNSNEICFASGKNIYFLDISNVSSSAELVSSPVYNRLLSSDLEDDKDDDIFVNLVNNFVIYTDTSTGKEKIACSFYTNKTIPDSTTIKFYDRISGAQEGSELVFQGLMSDMVIYNGYLMSTNQSCSQLNKDSDDGALVIRKL